MNRFWSDKAKAMHRLLNKAWALGLFFGASLWAQQTPYAFEKLAATDTITNETYLQRFGSADVRSEFLISRWKRADGQDQLALFKKLGAHWVIFPLFEQQTTENVKLSEDERYMTYVTWRKTSGGGVSKSRFYFCIVDIRDNKQMAIFQQSNDESWQVNASDKSDRVIQTGCSAQIVWLGKGNLTSVYTATQDFAPASELENCLPRGQYKIENDRLVRIK